MTTRVRNGRPLPHAITRFQERYGKPLAPGELQAMERRCRAGEGILARNPDGTVRHGLLVDGSAVIAIFSPASDRIITFPPRIAGTTAKTPWKKRNKLPQTRAGKKPPKSARKRGCWT